MCTLARLLQCKLKNMALVFCMPSSHDVSTVVARQRRGMTGNFYSLRAYVKAMFASTDPLSKKQKNDR